MICIRTSIVWILFITIVNAAYKPTLQDIVRCFNDYAQAYMVGHRQSSLEEEMKKNEIMQVQVRKDQLDSYMILKKIFFLIEKAMSKESDVQLNISLRVNPLRIALEHYDSVFIEEIMMRNHRWINQFKVRCINDILFGKPLSYNCLFINEQSIEGIFKSLINSIKAACECYPHEVHATLASYITWLNELCEQENKKNIFVCDYSEK